MGRGARPELSPAKHVRALSLLALLGVIGPAQAEAPLHLPGVDYVRVEKAARTMTLFSGGRAVYTITGLQLGDVPSGPKRF
jgi:hypothetical protein